MKREYKCRNCGAVLPASKYLCAACGDGTHHQRDGVEIQPGLFVTAAGANPPPKDDGAKMKKSPLSMFRRIPNPYGESA